MLQNKQVSVRSVVQEPLHPQTEQNGSTAVSLYLVPFGEERKWQKYEAYSMLKGPMRSINLNIKNIFVVYT